MYLRVLDIDDGETPHSLRAGCAVALALSGSVQTVGQIMRHVGQFGENSAVYYSRLPALVESELVADKLSAGIVGAEDVQEEYQRHVKYEG